MLMQSNEGHHQPLQSGRNSTQSLRQQNNTQGLSSSPGMLSQGNWQVSAPLRNRRDFSLGERVTCMMSPLPNLNAFTLLLCYALVWLQLPPLALTMYPPWPMALKLKPQFLLATTFGWQTPTATQFDRDSFILKVNFLTPPVSACGSITTNLYPELLADLTWCSESSLMSGCLRVGENRKTAPCFHKLSSRMLSLSSLMYFCSCLFTSSLLVCSFFLRSSLLAFREEITSFSVSSPSSFLEFKRPATRRTAAQQSSCLATGA